jgi:predicted SnoaL-like aldol condensation-catalyzing enzyme
MITSNKAIVLEVLKRAFVDRDPTVVKQYFGAHYKQHNPVIPDGPSAIAEMIPTLRPLIEIELSTRPGPQFIVPVAVEHVRM